MSDAKMIGDYITYTTNKGTFIGEITGNTWIYTTLLYYIVKGDISICPKTFKAQLLT